MHQAQRLIAEYCGEDTHALANSNTSRKLHLICELDSSDDPRAVEFLVHVAGNTSELDLARIEAVRALDLKRPSDPALHAKIAGVIAQVVKADPDDDVRNYAMMAAAYFMAIDAIADEVVRVLLDKGENSDLRWNAFAAVEKMGAIPKALQAMRNVRQDKEFERSADRVLKGWGIA